MKKERNQKLADELKNFLVKNEIGIDTRIYFNEMCYDFDSNGKVALLKDIKASDYFDCANNNTISMSFEGPLYDILNYCSPYHLAKKFYNIFKKYDLFGEQGDSWNLVAYSLSEDKEDEPDPRPESEEVYLYADSGIEELDSIQRWWSQKANGEENVSSCILGVGFEFLYNEIPYFMPPMCKNQEGRTWESFIPEVKEKLKAIGATDIKYKVWKPWGVK